MSATTSPAPAPTDVGVDAERRRLRDVVTTGLADPLAEIVRTLQRLALAHIEPETAVLDQHLLGRARTLAHALSQVIDELVADGTRRGALDSREDQETILVAAALESAHSDAREALGGRSVEVDCPPHAAVVTAPHRFHELLVALFAALASSGADALKLRAERRRGELVVEAVDVHPPAETVERVRRLARSLGGTVQPTAPDAAPGLTVWLPQQRAGD